MVAGFTPGKEMKQDTTAAATNSDRGDEALDLDQTEGHLARTAAGELDYITSYLARMAANSESLNKVSRSILREVMGTSIFAKYGCHLRICLIKNQPYSRPCHYYPFHMRIKTGFNLG